MSALIIVSKEVKKLLEVRFHGVASLAKVTLRSNIPLLTHLPVLISADQYHRHYFFIISDPIFCHLMYSHRILVFNSLSEFRVIQLPDGLAATSKQNLCLLLLFHLTLC